MADDKRGREKQAHDDDRRQRERDLAETLERWGEPEPPVDPADLDEVESALAPVEFPATGTEVVATAGDRTVESPDGSLAVEELVPDAEAETFQSAADVAVRIRRPTVAAAMKRIVEASETLQEPDFGRSRRDAYEKTLLALTAIDADDDDEGIGVVADWIVERISEDGKLPGSRKVRQRAATFCRENGYRVRDDEWLGA